jgi:hypothetical protein
LPGAGNVSTASLTSKVRCRALFKKGETVKYSGVTRKKVAQKKHSETFTPEELQWLDRVHKKVFENFKPTRRKKRGQSDRQKK